MAEINITSNKCPRCNHNILQMNVCSNCGFDYEGYCIGGNPETLSEILYPKDRQIWKARDEDELANEIRYNVKKWVKKDLLEMPITPQTAWLFNRWMERFNLKLEDIK